MTEDVVLTGSSDGFIRAVEILPTKFLGIIADHGEFPIERIKLDRHSKWLGSASHDEVLKLTDVGDALEDSDEEDGKTQREQAITVDVDENEDGEEAGLGNMSAPAKQEAIAVLEEDSDEPNSDEGQERKKKKRRKKNKDSMGSRKKADGGNGSFFSEL